MGSVTAPLDASTATIAYRITTPAVGDAPPVLFLHGLGGSRTAWEPQLEALGDEFRCIAWDMPGYGESAPIEPLTFPAIADAAATLLDELHIERAHVVGLSFGGQQALHLALRHPDRVDRLVLADTSARFGADGTDVDEWKRLRLDALDAGLTPADMAAGVIDAITAPGFAGPERDRTIAACARIPSAGLRASVECLPTHDVTERLGEIAAPTLVIVGELDDETPLAYAETLALGIPDATLRVIDGVAHLTPAEAPAPFNALVREFLRADVTAS
jgi:pimeloyl-ACP methyl ester carboxylesterase